MAAALQPEAIQVVDRHRSDLGEISDLAASIAAQGLLHPVVVTTSHRLVAGERRLAAVKSLGWSLVPVTIVKDVEDAVSLLRMERDENECRKEMTPSEKVSLGRALEELERPKAKERQAEGQERGRASRYGLDSVPANGNQGVGDVREIIAPAVGMSTATYSRAKQAVVAAESGDERAAEAVAEMDRTGKVTPAYEKWKGGPVNRGEAAPTTRDEYGLNGITPSSKDKTAGPSVVKNHKGAPVLRAVPNALNTLTGIALAMARVTENDLIAVPEETRAAWTKDLTDAISKLRAARDLIKVKETTS